MSRGCFNVPSSDGLLNMAFVSASDSLIISGLYFRQNEIPGELTFFNVMSINPWVVPLLSVSSIPEKATVALGYDIAAKTAAVTKRKTITAQKIIFLFLIATACHPH